MQHEAADASRSMNSMGLDESAEMPMPEQPMEVEQLTLW